MPDAAHLSRSPKLLLERHLSRRRPRQPRKEQLNEPRGASSDCVSLTPALGAAFRVVYYKIIPDSRMEDSVHASIFVLHGQKSP